MSLTKKILLKEAACNKPEKLPQKLFGQDVWVKPVTQFQRSRRLASLYNKSGDIITDSLGRARMYTIIDHLCDKDGTPLFEESDISDLEQLDALKADILISAIEKWSSEQEGNVRGRSSD